MKAWGTKVWEMKGVDHILFEDDEMKVYKDGMELVVWKGNPYVAVYCKKYIAGSYYYNFVCMQRKLEVYTKCDLALFYDKRYNNIIFRVFVD